MKSGQNELISRRFGGENVEFGRKTRWLKAPKALPHEQLEVDTLGITPHPLAAADKPRSEPFQP